MNLKVMVGFCLSVSSVNISGAENADAISEKLITELSSSLIGEPLNSSNKIKNVRPRKNSAHVESFNKIGPLLQDFMRNNIHSKPTAQGVVPTVKVTPLTRVKGSGKVQVNIHFHRLEDDVLASILSLGVEVEIVNTALKKVQAWVDLPVLEGLVNSSDVKMVSTPSYAQVRKGAHTSEGKAIIKAQELLDRGITGKGVRVGILSDGANNWTSARASGDLPARITLYGSCDRGVNDPSNCRFRGSCNEGTAMAEIIHDIAPDAELAVASVSTSLEFIQQLERLSTQFEADIIIDDLGFYGEPFFKDGDIAQAVANLPEHILYVSSAGNSAAIHYAAENYTYDDFFNPLTGQNERIHNFAGFDAFPQDYFHGFIVGANSAVVAILQWDNRQRFFGGNGPDFSITAYEGNGRVVGQVDTANRKIELGLEALCVANTSSQDVARFISLNHSEGLIRPAIKMFFLGARAIEYPVARGSIIGHPSLDRVLAVGSVNASEPQNDEVAFYSSQGPTKLNEINSSGVGHIVGTITRRKPDLVAIDGVQVSGAGGFPRRFFGTSAAAPHVAGLAALLMSVSPFVKAKDAMRAITQGATDIEQQGFDLLSGHGLISATGALEHLRYGFPIPAVLYLLTEDDD